MIEMLTGGPVFGLDANVAPAPISALLSVLLLLGTGAVGRIFLKLLPGGVGNACWLRWQAPVVGAACLSVLLFPVVLAGGMSRFRMAAVAALLLTLGVVFVVRQLRFRALKDAIGSFLAAGRVRQIVLVVLCGEAMLALAPTTDADALDYHVGVALDILNTGAFTFAPEWFHSRLAGSGEVLIALGLAIGAEQYGSLLQFAGIMAIVAAVHAIGQKLALECDWILLAIVTSPVLLAWVASPKPMLLPVAMTTLALLLVRENLSRVVDDSERHPMLASYFLVCLLVMVAGSMKLNFAMSGGVVGLFATCFMLRHRHGVLAGLIGLAMAILVFGPYAAWKIAHFGGEWWTALVHPFPGNWPGTGEFENTLRAYRDTTLLFPLSLLMPSGPGTVTTTLGAGVLFAALILVRGGKPLWREGFLLLGAALVVATFGAYLGQRTARFFLEPFIWVLLAAMFGLRSNLPAFGWAGRFIAGGVLLQALLLGAIMGVGLVSLFPGAIAPAWREIVLTRHAKDYAEMRWVGQVLPKDAVVVSEPRSIALMPRAAIANDWRNLVAPESEGERVYLSLISAREPGYLLVHSDPGASAPERPCTAGVYAGPFSAQQATRNPFNSGAEYWAWLLRLDSTCLGVPRISELLEKEAGMGQSS